MPSFGEKLKQEREKRHITLEQISVSTKISTRMLQALEEDKFNQLPGGIFNKGFVRAYSRCVGLDEDQTVADYLQASGDLPPVATAVAADEDDAANNAVRFTRLEASSSSDAPPRPLPWGMFAGVLLLIALALSFWNHHRQQGPRHLAASTATSRSGPAPPETSPAPTPTAAAPATGGTVPLVPTVDSLSATTSAPTPVAIPQNPASATLPAAQGEFQVSLHAREESWILPTVDGQADTSEILAAGSERTLHGHKEIILKVGNAGGVDLLFNGKKIDFAGESGQVKTITFGPLGLLPNAP